MRFSLEIARASPNPGSPPSTSYTMQDSKSTPRGKEPSIVQKNHVIVQKKSCCLKLIRNLLLPTPVLTCWELPSPPDVCCLDVFLARLVGNMCLELSVCCRAEEIGSVSGGRGIANFSSKLWCHYREGALLEGSCNMRLDVAEPLSKNTRPKEGGCGERR